MATQNLIINTKNGPVKGFIDTHPVEQYSSQSSVTKGDLPPVLKWLVSTPSPTPTHSSYPSLINRVSFSFRGSHMLQQLVSNDQQILNHGNETRNVSSLVQCFLNHKAWLNSYCRNCPGSFWGVRSNRVNKVISSTYLFQAITNRVNSYPSWLVSHSIPVLCRLRGDWRADEEDLVENRFSFSTSQLSRSLSPYSPFLDHCISWHTRITLSSGGALNTGSSDRYFYDPTSLIRSQSPSQRCIVVTGNYRINIFGFLSSPELSNADSEGLSGNYGLYDCVKLFEWVRIHFLSYSSLCTEALSRWGAMMRRFKRISQTLVGTLEKWPHSDKVQELSSSVTSSFRANVCSIEQSYKVVHKRQW